MIVCFLAQFIVLVMTYKVLNKFFPFLCSSCEVNQGGFVAKSSPLVIPSVAIDDRAFSAVVPSLWNSLPAEVKTVSTVLPFQRAVRTFSSIGPLIFAPPLLWLPIRLSFVILLLPLFIDLHYYNFIFYRFCCPKPPWALSLRQERQGINAWK